MNKYLIFFFAIVLGFFALSNLSGNTSPGQEEGEAMTPSPSESQAQDYSASFEIYTNGTKRTFSDRMYHELSSDVYISEPDPGTVHVKKAGTTWGDFFETLPFSLSSECLVTGTGQTFCSGNQGELKFYLNGVETPGALGLEIQSQDHLRVSYE